MSPPHQQQQSPVKGSTQARSGGQLPTSPTHMAAMRGATHQRHQQFEFPANATTDQFAQHQQQFLYPTPPHQQQQQQQQQKVDQTMNYMTPSPDSPGQWSSASPQSHSDWSEGIHSPPMVHQQQQGGYHAMNNGGGGGGQQQNMMQQQQQQQGDGVLI